jgi:hypothetical protein
MVAPNKLNQIPLADDEKSTAVVVYTDAFMLWGDAVTKERIRVSTWLITNMAPDIVCINNAMVLYPGGGSTRPTTYTEIHIPIGKIIAMHMMPPATDPLDYDPAEANRKLEPVSALVGSFHMDGLMRMAQSADLKKYLEISRELYTPLYDVTITHPLLTQLNLPRVSYVLVRQNVTSFAKSSPNS